MGWTLELFKPRYVKEKVHSFQVKHKCFRSGELLPQNTTHRHAHTRTRDGDALTRVHGRGSHRGPGLHGRLCPAAPSRPVLLPQQRVPGLLVFFRKFPVPTQSCSCPVQGKHKTKKLKSQNTNRIACFASRNLLALSPGTSSHPLKLLLQEVGWPTRALTAPGQTCPAGPRSGPPSRSPPGAAPWAQSLEAGRRSTAGGARWRGWGPRGC